MKRIYLLCNLFFGIFWAGPLLSQTILNESFDNATFVPLGWYKAVTPANGGQWERVTAGTNPVLSPHSGAGMARFNSPSAGWNTQAELGTKVLDLSGGATYRVRFWVYRGDNALALNDLLDIFINTQQNLTGAQRLGTVYISRGKTPMEAANGWYEYMFELPTSFNTATNYIIFKTIGYSSNVVYLDDVVVEAYTCNKPTNPTASNVANTTATLSWSAPITGTPDGYDWEIRIKSSAGGGAAGLVASGATVAGQTSIAATGLTPGLTYSFYVRSSCGTEKSVWTNMVNFTTTCDAKTIPYIENFDGITTGIPACTWVDNVNGGETWMSSLPLYGSAYSQSAPNALMCLAGGAGSSGAQNDWFYTAPLYLESGKCYQLSFAYRNIYWQNTESIRVKLGSAQNVAAMNIAELINIPAVSNDTYNSTSTTFTVGATGVYFLGFNHYMTLGGTLFIDNISVTESVGPPVGITANPIGATTAQLNWNPPACGLPTGYEWELRTSGAVGSGATGLVNIGSGTAANNTFTGLTENKTYTFYVRSKNGTINSPWSSGVVFQTICSIRPLPYIQNFDGVIAPALPPCVIKQDLNTVYNSWNTWLNTSYTKPNSVPNCMRVSTNNSTYAGNNWFFTPPFNFTANKSYRLVFYYRSDETYTLPEKLEVKYGMGANAASMTSAAIFNNTNIRNTFYKREVVDFVPTQSGTYNIGFHYISDALRTFLYIDDLTVEETPDCDVVQDVTALHIAATGATIKWQAPKLGSPNGYTWELRTSGAANSGATGLISTGTLPAGALSVPVSGLMASTAYTFYISSNCGATNSVWLPYVFTTACTAQNLPYTLGFEGFSTPYLPTCTKIEEQFDDYKWAVYTGIARTGSKALYHPFSTLLPFDDWFFSAPLQLTTGRTYVLSFYYRQEVSGYTDGIEMKLGRFAQGDSMTVATLYTNANVTSTGYQLATVNFPVPTSGVYYLGLHSLISSNPRGVAIDDLSVNAIAPELAITSQNLTPTSVVLSDTFTVNYTVANLGLANAGSHKVSFYLSADNVLTPETNGDILLGTYTVSAGILANANTGNLSTPLSIPCSKTAGNYTLFCVVDADGVIDEIDESNNNTSLPITVTEGAQWRGLVSTAWETPQNWSCNTVPGPTTDVVIKSGTIVVNQSTTIRSLTVMPGVNFSVMPGAILTVLH